MVKNNPKKAMSAPRSGKRRIDHDIHKIIVEGKHHVTMMENPHELFVKFLGPPGSLYEGGTWNVKLQLTENYPFKPPSIVFLNRIYHPNVEEESGIVSMDVVTRSWTVRHNLSDIFDYLLPELMIEPNFHSAVNKVAAAMCLHAPEEYGKVVEEYVRQYAKS